MRLAIVGAGGHGKVVADSAVAGGAWTAVVFFDDRHPGLQAAGAWAVVGVPGQMPERRAEFDRFVVAVGNNRLRLRLHRELCAAGLRPASIIHPSAQISRYASVGDGSVVMAGAVINVDAVVGVCSIVNTAASVDHDCVLGDGVHISPGARLGGGVIVGDCSWVGIGASVRHLIRIDHDAMIGAGAAVVADVAAEVSVSGVPAGPHRQKGG